MQNIILKIMLCCFKLENYGHEGPIVVNTDTPPFLPIWFDVGRELGYKIGDPNGYQVESFMPIAKAINKGQRSSSYNQYVKPIKNVRKNFTVLPYSIATRVRLNFKTSKSFIN